MKIPKYDIGHNLEVELDDEESNQSDLGWDADMSCDAEFAEIIVYLCRSLVDVPPEKGPTPD
jgi:hypothetical protein